MIGSPNIRALLRNRSFSRYITGEAVSMTGTWMQVMAQGWVMATLTDKAVMLGMVNFAMGIPMIALSMVGGTFADRYSKRNILLLTQVAQILCAVTLGSQVANGHIQIWQIITIAFILGISASFEMPSASALVPELVGKDLIATAIGVDRAIFHGTRLIGPALGGYVMAKWGIASAFYINAFSFVALIVALFTIRPHTATTTDDERKERGGIKAGFAYVRSDKPTLAMIALLAATVIFVFPCFSVLMPLYAKNVLGLGPDKLGLLMGISAIGSLTGSVGLLSIPRHRRRAVLLVAVVGVALGLTSLATAHQFAVAASSLVILTLGVSTLGGLTHTIVQERAPGPMRGRVSAIVGLSFFGLMPFAGLGVTSVADSIGIRPVLLLAGGSYLCVAVSVLLVVGHHIQEQPIPSATSES
ncbi:MAG: MFS transporter [Verrucomicrobiota bacterium]|jgi:MFS family permease